MTILGIDFGLKKVGLALSGGTLAEPYSVIKYGNSLVLLEKIKEIVGKEGVEKIIVGISDGEIAEKSREFGESLKKELNLEVEFFAEDLSTQDAQRFAIEAGIGQKKRREKEDSYAAAIILQGYLDS